jgi:hypothetical protein
MDLEHLTKHQILLLTLLVSFVTSIATGIVTVSLMDQAPPGVTRVINQIVERTVDTVTPSSTASQGAAAATTVVIKDDDLAAQSIAQVQKSVIRLVARGSDQLLTRGIIIDTKGLAVTDRAPLVATGENVFDAILPSGDRVPAVMRADANGTLAVLDVVVGTSTGYAAAVLGTASNLKLGQSVIRIGGTGADTVGMGVIARLSSSGTDASGATLEASVEAATPGSILMTLFGEVVGMTTASSQALGASYYTVLGPAVSTAGAEPSSP